MITPGSQVELRVKRPAIYLSPIGARAEVVDVKSGASNPGVLLLNLHWLFAARGECDGWYAAHDFAEVTPINLPAAA
jgi:hypothetical protein